MNHSVCQESDLPSIVMYDVKARKIATDCVIKLGHKNIGIIKSDDLQGRIN